MFVIFFGCMLLVKMGFKGFTINVCFNHFIWCTFSILKKSQDA